ncbi:MAG: lysophospholipid acyltransferase family protein, partial [bacterium]
MSDHEGISHDVTIETGQTAQRHPRQGLRPGSVWYRLVQYSIRFLLQVGWGLRLFGTEYLPAAGPFLICSNHPSELDPVALGSVLPFRPSFLAGHELERYPVIFWLLNRFDPVLVRRGTSDIGALRACLRRLRAGDVMVIYPEGGVV